MRTPLTGHYCTPMTTWALDHALKANAESDRSGGEMGTRGGSEVRDSLGPNFGGGTGTEKRQQRLIAKGWTKDLTVVMDYSSDRETGATKRTGSQASV